MTEQDDRILAEWLEAKPAKVEYAEVLIRDGFGEMPIVLSPLRLWRLEGHVWQPRPLTDDPYAWQDALEAWRGGKIGRAYAAATDREGGFVANLFSSKPGEVVTGYGRDFGEATREALRRWKEKYEPD